MWSPQYPTSILQYSRISIAVFNDCSTLRFHSQRFNLSAVKFLPIYAHHSCAHSVRINFESFFDQLTFTVIIILLLWLFQLRQHLCFALRTKSFISVPRCKLVRRSLSSSDNSMNSLHICIECICIALIHKRCISLCMTNATIFLFYCCFR